MTDKNLKRVQITDEESNQIVGGTLKIAWSKETGSYLYSDLNPSVRYKYNTTWIVMDQYLGFTDDSDDVKIQKLIDAGYIYPMQ